MDEAEENLTKALHLFSQDEEKDYHYSAALGTMGQIKYKKGAYQEAADCFLKAMEEVEKHLGRTQAYEILNENREQALSKLQEQEGKKQTEGSFNMTDKENNPELRAEKFTVQQGMLELSNSCVIKEMINTIQTTRNYESLTKMVSTNNDLLKTAISVGRIGQ